VAEADESDGSLVKFNATLGVITNLELDHTDHYRDLDDLITTMRRFAAGCGRLLANQDDPILSEHFQADAWWSVQRSDNVDFAALPVALEGDHTIADLYEQGERVGRITLPLPGLHNLSNALGALAACRMEGVPLERLITHLGELKAPGRRFDYRGDWQGRLVVDDYAHHPSEVAATLSMAALMVSSGRSPLPRSPKRLMAVFQPHRFSRTQQFQNEFALALSNVDIVVLAPVFSAGEAPISGVSSEALATCIQQHNVDQTVLVATTMNDLTDLVKKHSRADDLVLAMGAGDVNSLWSRLSPNSEQEQTSCRSTLTA
jgi:UDP-N-acetylmuramate--alanine ligase